MANFLNLDLDLVRTFVAVADMRSFTRAAERLGRTQSAVSLQMGRLEDRLGRRLLARATVSLILALAALRAKLTCARGRANQPIGWRERRR